MQSTFTVRVVTAVAGSPWTDEAVVLIDDRDALATLGRGRRSCWIGRRPDDVLGPTSPWIATATPHDARVARCDCFNESCGSLTARIVRQGDVVVWDDFRHTSDSASPTPSPDERTYTFSAAQYDAAVLGRPHPSRWEPTTRQAATLATSLLQSLDLGRHGFRHMSAAHRGDDEVLIEAITAPDSQRATTCLGAQVRSQGHESATHLADRVLQYVESGRFSAEAEVGAQFGPREAAPRTTGQRADANRTALSVRAGGTYNDSPGTTHPDEEN